LALQAEGFKLAVALKPLRADGRSWPRGTFVARVQRNPATLHEHISVLALELGVVVTPVQSAFADSGDVGVGSGDVVALHAPHILVAAGDGISETSFGWLWHYLARDLGVTFTPVRLRALSPLEDLARYTALFIPYRGARRLRLELGEDGSRQVKAWVGHGGW